MMDGPQRAGLGAESRRLADYSMAFSLLGELAVARTEGEAIERILWVFTTLCAPLRSLFLRTTGSGPALPVAQPSGAVIATDADRLAASTGSWSRTPSGRGFSLRIEDAAGALGILELEDVAVPDSIEHYVNLGLGLVPVCALAIRNASNFERLEAVNVELQRAIAEMKTLRGLLPICATCKRIRDDLGDWSQRGVRGEALGGRVHAQHLPRLR